VDAREQQLLSTKRNDHFAPELNGNENEGSNRCNSRNSIVGWSQKKDDDVGTQAQDEAEYSEP